jgi:hypothetical protein
MRNLYFGLFWMVAFHCLLQPSCASVGRGQQIPRLSPYSKKHEFSIAKDYCKLIDKFVDLRTPWRVFGSHDANAPLMNYSVGWKDVTHQQKQRRLYEAQMEVWSRSGRIVFIRGIWHPKGSFVLRLQCYFLPNGRMVRSRYVDENGFRYGVTTIVDTYFDSFGKSLRSFTRYLDNKTRRDRMIGDATPMPAVTIRELPFYELLQKPGQRP